MVPCIHQTQATHITACDALTHQRFTKPITDTDQITKEFNDLLLTKIG